MKSKKTTDITLRLTLFVIAVAAIFLFRPTMKSSSYEFTVNRPWTYNLLTAPFDIPVRLDSVSEAHLRDSLDRNFEPVYYRDTEIENSMLQRFVEELESLNNEHATQRNRQIITARLRYIYNKGIIASEAADSRSIRMITNNVISSKPIASFFTMRRAYTDIDSALTSSSARKLIAVSHLAEYIVPNILPDSAATERLRQEAEAKALAPIGVIQRGERIIDRGEVVTPQIYTILRTYLQMSDDKGNQMSANQIYKYIGTLLYIVILIAAIYTYFISFRRRYYDNVRVLSMVMLIIVAITLISFAMAKTFTYGLYMVPFAMIPIIITVFLDSRTAFFCAIVTMLLCIMVSRFPAEFIITQFVATYTAMVSLRELTKRSQIIRTAVMVFTSSALVYLCMILMQTGSIDAINLKMFAALGINALLLSFAYVIIFLLEKAFGFVSQMTLVELSDINHPLLRELSEECPGTFQHVTAVGNLAAAAANRIGANVQMVRTGALYHDIGKLTNPAFFTENQHGMNPHDMLSPEQSARIVIGHVTEGQRLAEKNKLPKQVKDFIDTHHGKGKARYFYTTWCNQHPDQQPDESIFSYPGPNPQSVETSIVMMADAVEAASRSLKDYSTESLTNLVNRIIDTQIAEGLHNESPISFRDIAEIKKIFISRLSTMYHSRISYPENNTISKPNVNPS
ncbi:MAG: HDIG domain-containing protein [Paramuribaculum sp.]|nr:HDIG domain-containing protein [Paramuribaculum sp.]